MTRTSRNLTVGLIVTVGLAGIGRTASAATRTNPPTVIEARGQQTRLGGAGVESDLHRHAHCDEYGELLQSAARGDRSHGDLRCVQRHRTALHTNLRPRQGPPRRVAPSGGHRCGAHGAGRPVPVPTAGAGCQLCGFARGAERRLRGRRPSRRRRNSCTTRIERGIAWGTEVAQAVLAWRATDGFSASYPPFTGGTAVGQWRPTPPAFGAMSAQGLAFTAMFVLANNTQFEPGPPRGLTSATYTDDFNAVKALGRKTGSTRTEDQTALARVLGGQRQRSLESGREPDCARQPPVHVRQQPASRGPEHRDGRHGVHHLERQAILRRRSERSDLAAGDLDPAGGHRRQSGHGS